MTINVPRTSSKLAQAVNQITRHGERVVLERGGKGVAAIVPMEDLAILEKLEDEHDARAARSALREKGAIPWEQIKAELGLRGSTSVPTRRNRKATA
jgi:PHD/YefM family antitoxin component YafN of YafNO toxin-antitoxin module